MPASPSGSLSLLSSSDPSLSPSSALRAFLERVDVRGVLFTEWGGEGEGEGGEEGEGAEGTETRKGGMMSASKRRDSNLRMALGRVRGSSTSLILCFLFLFAGHQGFQ